MVVLNYGNRIDLTIETAQKTMGPDQGLILRWKRMNRSSKRDPKMTEGDKMQLVSAYTLPIPLIS